MFNCWSLLYGDNAEMLLDQGKMRVGCVEMVLVHVEMAGRQAPCHFHEGNCLFSNLFPN
jgi:hypothetical protein